MSWPRVRLGELVLSTQYGTAEKANEQGHGQPVLRMNNLTHDGRFDLSDVKWVELPSAEQRRLDLQRGDLLFNRTNSRELVGKTGVWDGPEGFSFAGYLVRVRLRRDLVLPGWVSAFLNGPEGKAILFAMAKPSVNMANISASDLLRLEIPVAPLQHQQQTIATLDKADAIRRKRKESIALTEELLRSAFLEMFGDPVTNPKGWPVKPLGELADTASGVTKGKRYDGQTMVTLPYMRVANVQDGHLVLDEIKTITVSEEDGRRYQLREGDVLLTEGGDPDKLGRGTVWRGEIANCIHQNHIFRVRPSSEVRSEYLSAIIGSERGKRYFLRAAKQTTGIATINMTQLKAFPVLLPPVALQAEYGAFIERVAAARGTFQRRWDMVDNLFNSLVARAFSGELSS